MGNITNIKAINREYENKTVSVHGWINNFRSSGKIVFIELRDGTGYIQAVAGIDDVPRETFESLKSLNKEYAIKLTGKVTINPRDKVTCELIIQEMELISDAKEYPLSQKDPGPDFLLQNRHLWLRSKSQWAILRIRNTIIQATTTFFYQEGFIKIDSPIFTPVACEGTTTLFEVDYFDLGKAYLSQSGQFYLEAAIAAHGKVYDFGPVFRAEKSKTRKHLIEFWMMDAEMAFHDFNDNIQVQEKLVYYIVQEVLKHNQQELAILNRDLTCLAALKIPFERITHRDIVKLLQKNGSTIEDNQDLGAQDEILLAKHFTQPVIIEKWPKDIKAFYMKVCPDDPQYVLASDVMAPEGFGELIGGSQREDNYDVLLKKMQDQNLPIDNLSWYLDLRKYGSVPHSGFGYGLERLVTWICGLEHIRESIPFPRMLYRFKP